MPRKKRRDHGDGSIFKRASDGRWVGKYRAGEKDGKPVYKQVYGNTSKEVEEKLSKKIQEVKKYKPGSLGSLPVAEYLQLFLDARKSKLKPKSYDRLEQTIRLYVTPAVGGILVDILSSDDVVHMLNALQDAGRSRSTLKKAREAISSAYRWGMNATPQKVTFNPALAAEIPSESVLPSADIRWYTLEEVGALVRAAYATWGNGNRIYRLGGVVELLVNTGLRLAELVSLEWKRDIDIEHKTLSVSTTTAHVRDYAPDAKQRYKYVSGKPKSKAGTRAIPLTAAAIHALEDLQKFTGETKYVVATEAGTPARERAIDRMLEAIGKRAGMPDDRLPSAHPLRHTFATLYLYGNGKGHRGDIKLLSLYLGHSSVQITYDTYVHVSQKIKAEDAEAFPSITDTTKMPEKEEKETKETTPTNMQNEPMNNADLQSTFPDTLVAAFGEAEKRKNLMFRAVYGLSQDEHTEEEENIAQAHLLLALQNYNLQSIYVHNGEKAKETLGAAFNAKDCVDTINALFVYKSWPTDPYTENPIYETYLPALLGRFPVCRLPVSERAKTVNEMIRLINGDSYPDQLMSPEEYADFLEKSAEAAEYYSENPYSDYDETWEDYQEET